MIEVNDGPRILVLTSTYPRWAGDVLPRFVHDLAVEQVALGARVRVIAPYSRGAQQREIMDGVEVIRYRYWFTDKNLLGDVAKLPAIRRNPLNLLQVPCIIVGLWFALWRSLKDFSPQVVHAHWIIPQGFIAALHLGWMRRRPRLVVTALGADIFGLRRLTGLKRWVLKRSDATTGLSQAICDEIRGAVELPTSHPLHRIPLGVRTDHFHPRNRDDGLRERYGAKGIVLLFVGRLSEKKGVGYLLDAMPAVVAEFPDVSLWIAGFGEEEEALKSKATSLGLMGRCVHFIGKINHDEAPALYATADIFVGPSIVAQGGDTEGLGLVFVEAQASGCAVVASDLPAVRDIIQHGVTGLFAEQKNPASIAAMLLTLLREPEVRRTMALRGRESAVALFDAKVVARRYQQVLLPEAAASDPPQPVLPHSPVPTL